MLSILTSLLTHGSQSAGQQNKIKSFTLMIWVLTKSSDFRRGSVNVQDSKFNVLVFHFLTIKPWENEFNHTVEKPLPLSRSQKFAGMELLSDYRSCGSSLLLNRGAHSNREIVDDSPMVGWVVTNSPSFSLYRMVVFPEESRPSMSTLKGCKERIFKAPKVIANLPSQTRSNCSHSVPSRRVLQIQYDQSRSASRR